LKDAPPIYFTHFVALKPLFYSINSIHGLSVTPEMGSAGRIIARVVGNGVVDGDKLTREKSSPSDLHVVSWFRSLCLK